MPFFGAGHASSKAPVQSQFRSAKGAASPPVRTNSLLEAQRRAALGTQRSSQSCPADVASILILALGYWTTSAPSSLLACPPETVPF